jgi:hypothetical protein
MNKLCLVVFVSLAAFVAANYVDLTITVDNTLEELYIDGVQIPIGALPNRLDWPSVDVVSIPRTTQVVAVFGSDAGVIAGILASAAGDLLLTNGSWKCVDKDNVPASSTPSLAWSMPDYDDSEWPAASVIVPNPNDIHHDIAAISHNAKWIWTEDGIENSRVLCRGRMNPKPPCNVPTTTTQPPECSVDVDDRVECGWPGIPRETCLARVGCCFDDSIDDEIWCFKSTEYKEAVCDVDPDDRVECGWPGIPEEVCLSHPQCCFDNSTWDVLWCFHQHDYEYTVRSEVCDIHPDDREECGWPGILISECLSHAGCCFDDSIPDVLWCFHQKQEDCNVWPAERTDCGSDVISREECESMGCCFDDTYYETKWCFYKNKVMLPECEVYRPEYREACEFSTESFDNFVSQCQMDQDRCCYDDTYSYKNPPFCYKQLSICNVAPEDRVDCGFDGITADRCLARGCCFDDSQEAIWCYEMPPQYY